tara:strand:+ start:327 stop:869 length:543 start_codon:yes stop_codon:yes gene_type:complete
MANAILRALGANCANDTSSTRWPWRYFSRTNASATNHIGWENTPNGESPTTATITNVNEGFATLTGSSFSDSVSINTNLEANAQMILRFSYQAFEAFDITIDYSGSVSSGGPSIIGTDYGAISRTGNFSDTRTYTLPRAVRPIIISTFITAQATGYDYADYPGVNQRNKIASASITITLD